MPRPLGGLVAGDSIRLRQIDRPLDIVVAIFIVASTAAIAWVFVESEGGVALTVSTDKPVYAPHEPVEVVIMLKNYGSSTAKLVYPNSLIILFSIVDSDGQLVFSGPRTALMVITVVKLEPGGTRYSGCIWKQVDDSGKQVELPDEFTVHAASWSKEYHLFANATFLVL